jgi:hypothetical protein
MVQYNCAACRYWSHIPHDRPDMGMCHRYPPVYADDVWTYPTTHGDEWCGEYANPLLKRR